MATTYTPDPTATQAPASQPDPDDFPLETLPASGDGATAASVAQAFKVLGDNIAWLKKPRAKAGSYDQPIRSYRDAQLRRRFAIDHFGMQAGLIRRWQETWDRDGTPLYGTGAKWFSTLNGGQIINRDTAQGAIDGAHYRTLLFQPLRTTTAATWFEETFPNVFTGAATVVVVETTLALDTVGGSANTLWQFGLSDSFTAGTRGIVVGKSDSDVNWQFTSPELGSADTGVPPVANTHQRFRIELLGATGSDGGTTARANLFIDGVLVASHNAPVSANARLKVMFGGTRITSGATDERMSVGPVTFSELMFPTVDAAY